ncbi:hypothetical protein [Paenibacillus sp. R14(2021)]|uniref:hypothetical protein n=1 Tax=Paenibacillus sp. R14(2021) TaxID=2859228 RepID=UPI001C611416|nr:hypothetical protein [Paenibacillus sp. R14(2021)]
MQSLWNWAGLCNISNHGNGNGKKLGLYKKLSKTFGGTDGGQARRLTRFGTGKIENILANNIE